MSALPPAVIPKQFGHRRASLTMDVYGHLLADDSAVLAALIRIDRRNPFAATDSVGRVGLEPTT